MVNDFEMTTSNMPRIKDRADAEDRLLRAAMSVFSELGFRGATTRMIASKAGLNVALIARYFDGKYGLLLALIRRHMHDLHSAEIPYPMQDSLVEECREFVRYHFRRRKAELPIFKIVIGQFLTDAEFMDIYRSQAPKLYESAALRTRLEEHLAECATPLRLSVDRLIAALDVLVSSSLLFEHILADRDDESILDELSLHAEALALALRPA